MANISQNLGIPIPHFSSERIKSAENEIISIKEINQKMLDDLSSIFNGSKEGIAEENLQSRIRVNILMSTANKKGALLLNTGNKTDADLEAENDIWI